MGSALDVFVVGVVEVGVMGVLVVEIGVAERILAMPAGAEVARDGGWGGSRSACGTGRRRLRIEDAAEMGSVTTRCFGTGVAVAEGSGGGEGGGECW
jgi:hypothetical protein